MLALHCRGAIALHFEGAIAVYSGEADALHFRGAIAWHCGGAIDLQQRGSICAELYMGGNLLTVQSMEMMSYFFSFWPLFSAI